LITLTTDFGTRDHFVGVMKGVILGINPEARIVDLTHGIPAQDVRAAALVLAESFRFFPRGTVHVVVVDPGVGSRRRPIAASAHGHRFVAPDNGVLSGVLSSDTRSRVYHLNATEYFLEGAGGIFDGRDVFAPVAAWLDRGRELTDLGEEVTDPKTIELPAPEIEAGEVKGQVIHIDSFGNAITNIRAIDLEALGKEGPYRVMVKGVEAGVVSCYADGDCKVLHALINSSGLLEVFLDRGSASSALGLAGGEPVTVRLG
jgi:S-adenosylmethionine hydrolase